MRRAANPPITAQMYRHFAVMTLALTGLVAFFANGEAQDAAAAQTVATQAEAPAKKAEAKPRKTPEPDTDIGTWGPDIDIAHSGANVAYDGGWTPEMGPWQPDLGEGAEVQPGARLSPRERDELARAMARDAAAQQAGA